MGARQRLLPDAGRARGPRLLRRPQPDLHGRQVQRRARPPSRAQQAGQGTPVHLTIPTAARGCRCASSASASPSDRQVEADVFLLTDDEPELLAGGHGLDVARSEAANDFLLDDLRSDRGMEWVPEDMWFTHLHARRGRRRPRLRPRHRHRRADRTVARRRRPRRARRATDIGRTSSPREGPDDGTSESRWIVTGLVPSCSAASAFWPSPSPRGNGAPGRETVPARTGRRRLRCRRPDDERTGRIGRRTTSTGACSGPGR